jgi:hypothetical protein
METPGLQPPSSYPSYTSPSFPWYQVWWRAISRPNVESYQELLQDPNAGIGKAYLWVVIGGLISFLVAAIFQAAFGGVYSKFFEQFGIEGFRTGNFFVTLLCGLPVSIIAVLIVFTINTGILHLIALMLGGRGAFGDLLYAYASFGVPLGLVTSLVASIPFVNCLSVFLGIYGFVLGIIAINAVHKFGWGKAVLTAIIIPLIFFFLACCTAAGLALLAPSLSEVFSDILKGLEGVPLQLR